MQGILFINDLFDILPNTIKEKLILFFLNSGDGQFTEYLVDRFELPHFSHSLVCITDHFLY